MNFKTLQDMKKNLLFFVAIASMLALVSCSQDTKEMLDNDGAIKFRTSINGMTRASWTTTENLKTFNVTSFVSGHSTNYFTNWQMVKSGDTWTSSDKHYWPPTQTLNFFAYAPTSNIGIGTVSISPSEQTIKGFTMQSLSSNQTDLVVAYNSGTKAANENSGVALNFKHALAMIDVYAKNVRSNDYRIDVLGVKLAGFKSSADFTFPNTKVSGTIPLANWKNAKKESSCYYNFDGHTTLRTNYMSLMAGYFMVIPQELTAWNKTTSKSGAYIGVLLRIYKIESAGRLEKVFPESGNEYAYVAVPIDTKLLPGKFYKFKLNFMENGAGNIAPDQINPYIPNNVNPNPGPGGSEVLGGAIKVTVSVDDWGSTNGFYEKL